MRCEGRFFDEQSPLYNFTKLSPDDKIIMNIREPFGRTKFEESGVLFCQIYEKNHIEKICP